MKIEMRNRILWAFGAVMALGIGFILCRFTFFHLHGMKQWPFVLFIFGLTAILIAAVFNARKAMYSTAGGYIIGFAMGMLFNWDTFHPEYGPNGSYTNNGWLIWLLSFLLFIAVGLIWEIAGRIIHKHIKHNERGTGI